jgi:hypothetical protein
MAAKLCPTLLLHRDPKKNKKKRKKIRKSDGEALALFRCQCSSRVIEQARFITRNRGRSASDESQVHKFAGQQARSLQR